MVGVVNMSQTAMKTKKKETPKKLSKQFAKGYIKQVDDMGDGKLGVAVISTGTVDRDGDTLSPDGWSFKNFLKNPVLLWSHNASSGEKRPPIGKVEDVEVRDGKVYFTPVFDMEDSFAKEIFRKYKNGFLNAFSIGFLPQEWKQSEIGYDFIKQEALEFSSVNVPANPEALVILREEGFSVSKSFDEWKVEEKEKEYTDFNDLKKEMKKHIFIRGKMDGKEWDKIFTQLSDKYKQFGRVAPNIKHVDAAISKVARGKKVHDEKLENKSKTELIALLHKLNSALEDKSNSKEKKQGGE